MNSVQKYILVIVLLIFIGGTAAFIYKKDSPVNDTFGKLKGFINPEQPLDLSGKKLTSSEVSYCRDGLTMPEVIEKENDLWRFQVYTVQPGAVNSKFRNVQF